MKIDFLVNPYLLVWNLLYAPSISLKTNAYKKKLWLVYKNEYKKIENDKEQILLDVKNFIPDDNTMYEKVEDTNVYDKLVTDATRHRVELLRIWDTNKKEITKNIKEILKVELGKYNVLVLPSYMDSVIKMDKIKNLGWGKKQDLNDEIETITNIIHTLVCVDLPEYNDELDIMIRDACLELMIKNELYTRIGNKSNNLSGNKDLKDIKQEIYPYFLMYLGVDLENTTKYMARDNFAFDISKYTNEYKLRELNYIEFIDFIVRNKKLILKIKKIGLEII